MKLTKSHIKQLIKEELQDIIEQGDKCGLKPPLPKNWRKMAIDKDPKNPRTVYRNWYNCKKSPRSKRPETPRSVWNKHKKCSAKCEKLPSGPQRRCQSECMKKFNYVKVVADARRQFGL